MKTWNEKRKEPRPNLSVCRRPASMDEAERIRQAIDRLLVELVNQERARRRIDND